MVKVKVELHRDEMTMGLGYVPPGVVFTGVVWKGGLVSMEGAFLRVRDGLVWLDTLRFYDTAGSMMELDPDRVTIKGYKEWSGMKVELWEKEEGGDDEV